MLQQAVGRQALQHVPAIGTVNQASFVAIGLGVVFFGGMDSVSGLMIREMESLDINAKLVGGDCICANELVKLACDAAPDN